ncbi:PREDICTED: protein CHROMATIN REMODELING 24 isoform X2 [Nelumbo nucifera]|uniref:Protein CHROMATIN REMODELING 24 isoform X2 n=1 Tax=Nelumbo nucifera TaxID=4432 RepID=A0A1U8AUX1_NELNU|nr:PREDICTED: protein CHROMATIN REMODELING 24 isoform X2 [Nelumbo nucifera]
MAEKKPLSLNDRHSRLLEDLSSHRQPPKPSQDPEQPRKVKLEGRRRLCKLSSTSRDDDDETVFDAPSFAGITDFDSPPAKNATESVPSCGYEFRGFDSPPGKTVANDAAGGGNEIRDILNELSSRLEYLSIEKRKQIPKTAESIEGDEVPKKQEDVSVVPEYANASSPFPLSSDPSGSSSDAVTQFKDAKNVEEKAEKPAENPSDAGNLKSKPVSDNLAGRVRILKNASREHMRHSLVPYDDDEDDDNDDCVVLSSNEAAKDVKHAASIVREEVSNAVSVDFSEDYTDGSVAEGDEMDSITLSGASSTYRLPGKIAKMLYPHQRDGLKWLWSLHCRRTGGILGDDMGLGKTMQMCSFLAGLFHSGLIRRALIVAPKTLLSHWIKELSAVGLSEKTRDYFGACAKLREYELQYILQDKGVLLTTYDILRNNTKSLIGDSYFHDERSEDNITWDYIILDEGHLIKNPSTQRAKSLLEIPSAHRIIISGTPLQNNLKELWALFNFCCPGLLGDKNEFKERYEKKVLRGNEKNASDREKRIGSTVAKELRDRIEPYFLRRLKSEVILENEATKGAKLSKKNEVIVWLRLSPCQRQLYEAFLNSELVLSSFDGSPLAALTILKKICDHPFLLTKRAAEDVLEGMDSMLNPEDLGVVERMALHLETASYSDDSENMHYNVSCKITFILSLLDNLIPEGHNVLIFSQTRKMLNLIQEAIVSKGYKFLRIDGTTKISDREKTVNDFQEGEGAPIFLLTSQVGGLGLTLTKADRVIVVDPAWNPSTDNQSVDRAYRIGQKKDVIVYRLMTCGTIEEKIYKMQVFKGGLFKSATEHKEQTRYFSQQDLKELFSLPKQGFDVSLTQQQLHEEHDRQCTMEDSLRNHIKFLESQGIAGVSHHSLLFSKTAPLQHVEEEELLRAQYAFKPKDVKLYSNSASSGGPGKPKEVEIIERIERLSQTLANKATISRLPDKGDKIRRQVAELNLELDKIRMEDKRIEKEIIDLDDISGDLHRVLTV